MKQACYWIIGNETTDPALAIDVHNAEGDLCEPTYTTMLRGSRNRARAHAIAVAYASQFGVPASNVHYDDDSTEFYRAA